MAHILAQVSIPHDNGLPEDGIANTYHFDVLDTEFPASNHLDPVHTALTTLYQAFDSLLSAHLASTATVKYYSMQDAIPRAPIRTSGIALTLGTTALPPELAICASFHGADISGAVDARRRGRVYLGPLDSAQCGTAEQVGGGAITTVRNAFSAFAATFPTATTPSVEWCVYSRANNALVPVSNGWVDNAWDVQRRRGRAATSRSIF